MMKSFFFTVPKVMNGKMNLKLAINSIDTRWLVRNLPNPFNGENDDFSSI